MMKVDDSFMTLISACLGGAQVSLSLHSWGLASILAGLIAPHLRFQSSSACF